MTSAFKRVPVEATDAIKEEILDELRDRGLLKGVEDTGGLLDEIATDLYRAMLAASPEPPAEEVSAWQPIETAPKDCRDVLCYVNGIGMGQMVLYWNDGYWREKANGMGLKIEPTHWQPLPAPPPLPKKQG